MENKNKDMFNIGDFVIIKEANTENKTLGKIEEIYDENGELFFKYNEYYFPEKTQDNRKEYHSKYEVFKTNEIEKEYFSSILKKCDIIKYEQFIRKLQIIKDKKIQNMNTISSILENTFFYRQIYNNSDKTYYPDIELGCFCNKIFNPDKNFITCRECKEIIHTDCFVNSGQKSCLKCSNDLEKQLEQNGVAINVTNYETYYIKNNQNDSLLGHKRERVDSSEEKTQNKIKKEIKLNEIEQANNINIPQDKHPLLNLSVKNQGGEKARNGNEERTNYPNLNEERRKNLITLIEKLESSNNNDLLDKSLSTEDKSRRTFRNKISYALLYGIEELKEYGTWEKIKTKELHTPNINSITAIKICSNNAIAIETAIFYNYGESIQNRNYKNKYKTLLLNLLDSRNPELRFSILNGDISANELVKLSSEQLAPSKIKNMRMERQNKYFKEQVLMKEDMKIIAKTHKGEAFLNIDNNPSDNENEFKKSNNDGNFDDSSSEEKSKANPIVDKTNANYNSNVKKSRINENLDRKKEMIIGDSENIIKANNLQNFNSSITSKINKAKELKYRKLSQDMQDFFKILDDYSKENLINKLNEKLKSNLKPATVNEIKDFEARINNNLG